MVYSVARINETAGWKLVKLVGLIQTVKASHAFIGSVPPEHMAQCLFVELRTVFNPTLVPTGTYGEPALSGKIAVCSAIPVQSARVPFVASHAVRKLDKVVRVTFGVPYEFGCEAFG